MFHELDVIRIYALLDEKCQGHYKVNFIITESGRIMELQYDTKLTVDRRDFKLLKKFRLNDDKLSLPSHDLVSILLRVKCVV